MGETLSKFIGFDSPFQSRREGKYDLLKACRRNASKNTEIYQRIHVAVDVNITDDEGKTALFYVVDQSKYERLDVIQALIDAGADVNITDNKGKTALFYAVQHWDHESMNHPLIDAGAHTVKMNWLK